MKDKSIEGGKKKVRETTENLKFERHWISPKKPPMSAEEQLQQRWRGEKAQETERKKSRSKTSSKPAMADYILSRAPRQPGRSRPARPVVIGKMGGKREGDGVFFSPFLLVLFFSFPMFRKLTSFGI
jgi:hypothetical protein